MIRRTCWLRTASAQYTGYGALVGIVLSFIAPQLNLFMHSLLVTAARLLHVQAAPLLSWGSGAASLLLVLLGGLVGMLYGRFSQLHDEVSSTDAKLRVEVTDRMQVLAALQESEQRFRLLSASSPVGIFQTDATGRVVYTNTRWQEMAGLTA